MLQSALLGFSVYECLLVCSQVIFYRMVRLHEGKRIKVWWPADDRPYAATVTTLSSSDIELLYDDNTQITYSLAGSICDRIKIGEVRSV